MARAGIVRTLAAVDSGRAEVSEREGARLLVQMKLWGLVPEGTRVALRLDSLHAPRGTNNSWFIRQWASELALADDTATVDSILSLLPGEAREDVLVAVASAVQYRSQALADRYSARMTRPSARADHLRRRSSYALSRQDTVAARRILEEAVALVRDDTTAGWVPWYAISELFRIGGDVSVDNLVDIAHRVTDDWWTARTQVAQLLLGSKRSDLARPVLDSLAAHIPTQPLARRPSSRIMLLQLRGTPADSAAAAAIQDSLSMAHDATVGRDVGNLDWRITSRRDTAALIELLSSETLEHRIVLQLVYSLRALATLPVNQYRRPAVFDSLRPLVRIAVERLPRILDQYSPLVRDSVLAYHVAPIAFLDTDRALATARRITTPRFRERANAEVVARLVRTDFDAALRLSAGLQDSVARGIAFGPLSQTALSGSRLALASDLASRATGEARVRAFFVLAREEWENRMVENATRHVLIALEAVTPIVRCDGCLVVTTTPPPEPVVLPQGMDARLIADVIALAVELGQRQRLTTWASSQRSARARAIAHLAIVEGMSRVLLGWQQSFPMH